LLARPTYRTVGVLMGFCALQQGLPTASDAVISRGNSNAEMQRSTMLSLETTLASDMAARRPKRNLIRVSWIAKQSGSARARRLNDYL
jgi:hypothetical protein